MGRAQDAILKICAYARFAIKNSKTIKTKKGLVAAHATQKFAAIAQKRPQLSFSGVNAPHADGKETKRHFSSIMLIQKKKILLSAMSPTRVGTP